MNYLSIISNDLRSQIFLQLNSTNINILSKTFRLYIDYELIISYKYPKTYKYIRNYINLDNIDNIYIGLEKIKYDDNLSVFGPTTLYQHVDKKYFTNNVWIYEFIFKIIIETKYFKYLYKINRLPDYEYKYYVCLIILNNTNTVIKGTYIKEVIDNTVDIVNYDKIYDEIYENDIIDDSLSNYFYIAIIIIKYGIEDFTGSKLYKFLLRLTRDKHTNEDFTGFIDDPIFVYEFLLLEFIV